MNIYEKCLKRKGEKIANNMVMLNASANFIILFLFIYDVKFLVLLCQGLNLFVFYPSKAHPQANEGRFHFHHQHNEYLAVRIYCGRISVPRSP